MPPKCPHSKKHTHERAHTHTQLAVQEKKRERYCGEVSALHCVLGRSLWAIATLHTNQKR